MSKSPSRRFPVTVTHLPVTRCQLCHRAVACRPGAISATLTGHYRRAHPGALDPASRQPAPQQSARSPQVTRWWCYPALRHLLAGHGPAAGYRRLIKAKVRARRGDRRAGDGAQPGSR
jgi:hypothetical protein